MKIEIKSILGKILFEGDFSCISDAVASVVKSGADLSGADLSGANLSMADLSGADLFRADLSGADLSEADLFGADLSGADLSGANLSGADLSRANLSGANLSGADLSRANLSGADLSGADLSGADLSEANLSMADLSRADLFRADLSGVDLSRANLSRANLSPKIKPLPIQQMVLKAINHNGNALEMSGWHTCETTHCRAGWATHLHPEGALLESIYGTSAAAALIFNACGSPIPSFTCGNDEAMEDIINQAELEKKRMGDIAVLMPDFLK